MALPRVDRVLERCLSIVSSVPNEVGTIAIGLTITIGGVVISGLTISEQEYFRLLGDQLGQLIPPDDNEPPDTKIRDQSTELGRRTYEQRQKDEAKLAELTAAIPEGEQLPAEQVEALSHQYIYFKDATIFNGDRVYMPLWRARLADVTGWGFGSYPQN